MAKLDPFVDNVLNQIENILTIFKLNVGVRGEDTKETTFEEAVQCFLRDEFKEFDLCEDDEHNFGAEDLTLDVFQTNRAKYKRSLLEMIRDEWSLYESHEEHYEYCGYLDKFCSCRNVLFQEVFRLFLDPNDFTVKIGRSEDGDGIVLLRVRRDKLALLEAGLGVNFVRELQYN